MNTTRTARLFASILLLAFPIAAHSAQTASELAAALASGDRIAVEKERDAGRKPAEVVTFLGIEPGMTVLDLIAAGGYYTEVLSVVVGDAGKVYAQNPPSVLEMRDGANDKAMTARLSDSRLSNVERVDQNLADAKITPGSIDVAMTALNFHDIYNGRGPAAADSFLADVYRLLKPGGVLGIIDHRGNASENNNELHRIDESLVRAAIEASPFELEASSDILQNPQDDHTLNVFDPSIRGKTDRFVLRLRKPPAPQSAAKEAAKAAAKK